jgi:hypothetical protein
MNVQDIVLLRKKAESAVADMPDGELKQAAFEVAFSYLLSGRASPSIIDQVPAQKKSAGARGENSATPTGRILALRDEGFFAEPRGIVDVQEELRGHGWHYALERLGTPLLRLVQQKQLRRNKVPEAGKRVWKYVNA